METKILQTANNQKKTRPKRSSQQCQCACVQAYGWLHLKNKRKPVRAYKCSDVSLNTFLELILNARQ